VVGVARCGWTASIGSTSEEAMAASHRVASGLIERDRAVYGLSTGFGALADRYIPPSQRAALQLRLVRSHAATVGEEVEGEVVRAMMLLRAASLAKGYSGVRPVLAHRLVQMLNAGYTPVVREHGSLGCSGDLAPLAHVALALVGEGEVVTPDGVRASARDAGVAPLELEAKEGLALINGTDGMAGMLCLACADVDLLLRNAEVAAAMSVEALLGTDQAFLPELAALRPHPGQAVSAANILAFLAGSGVVASHRAQDTRVQDAYSLRCAPQVIGAARDTLNHARSVTERELSSAIDNPVVLPDGRVASCGNFHGAPLAYVADFLAIAVADVASISERRIDRLLDPARSHGLPPFLAGDPGVDSGLMLAQYTAAAMVSECRRLAVPASVDSIPTSAMQEDHVSMGWSAARKLRRSIDNAFRVVAIEIMAAARGIDLRRPLVPGPATEAVLAVLRAEVDGPGADRYLAPEMDRVTEMVKTGRILLG
jgi:histidine ammonia-lyase